MAIKEVRSRISSSSPRHPGPGSVHELSPGARSAPSSRSRGDQAEHPAETQSTQAHISLGGGDEPAEVRVTGPEQRTDRRRDSTPLGEPREQRSSVSDRTEEGPRHEPQPLPED
jgi:hypothetical protein